MVRGAWLYVLRKGPDNWPPVSNAGSRRRRAGAGAAGAVGHHRRGRGGRLAAAQALLKGGGRLLRGGPPRDDRAGNRRGKRFPGRREPPAERHSNGDLRSNPSRAHRVDETKSFVQFKQNSPKCVAEL